MNRKTRALERARQYALESDFCAIFKEQTGRLYLLAFLLTADAQRVEECLVEGLEDCMDGNPVFKEWAHAWSLRTVIKRAIRMIPRMERRNTDQRTTRSGLTVGPDAEALISTVMQMPVFDRFVFVMSLLEGYTDRDCATLLHCPVSTIAGARVRTLGLLKPEKTVVATAPVYKFQVPVQASALQQRLL